MQEQGSNKGSRTRSNTLTLASKKELFCNDQGFSIMNKVSVEATNLNTDKIVYKSEFFKNYMVILSFVSQSWDAGIKRYWLLEPNHAIRPKLVQHYCEA
jgi:hypothetical protein